MTNNEALSVMEKYHSGMSVSSDDYMSAFNKAIIALKKQAPKKPILHTFVEDGEKYSYYTCGNICDMYCEVHKQDKFCRICGQAIDWSENSEGDEE